MKRNQAISGGGGRLRSRSIGSSLAGGEEGWKSSTEEESESLSMPEKSPLQRPTGGRGGRDSDPGLG
ncbi:hypothetical protein HPP92_001587 [Vanilla planifolia]|uniref:Uncharacterized protein n=1 Tax=Vanilla planifolia TaxID=51239 RepID=A0A835RRD3_VANPL|nr:hypothetical protein HPP92_001587 [Vanilla planifolia]